MNEHIIEYLNYYIELENPQYAVLLIGKWGCGKTFFIKDLINKWDNLDNRKDEITIKPIYVSLNGLADIHSINEKIRAAISPFFYSRGMKVAKNVFRGLLKTTTKIDLNFDDDDNSDGNILFSIDSLGILDPANKEIKGKRILIFDDIERCKIKTDEIFGYINNFVEHSNCKVILLADEEKIIAKYQDNNSKSGIDYKDFKEKLIGQTFEVKSDIDTAVNHFISESKKINQNTDLTKNEDLVKKIFISSELDNLRVLKQALLDFNRLTTFIQDDFINNENYFEFIKNLLAYFIIIYAEYKTGNVKIQEFQGFNFYEKKEDNPIKIAENKYNSILDEFECTHSSFVFPIKKLVGYIEKGFISKDELNNIIKSNAFFRTSEEQDWEKLWMWPELNDNLFIDLRDKVWKQFSKGDISETTVLFHIAGIFISLIEENLINKNKDYVVRKSKQILKKLFKEKKVPTEFSSIYGHFDSSWGKQYHSYNSQEFLQLKEYMMKLIKDTQATESVNYVKELFDDLNENSVFQLNDKLKKPLPEGGGWYEYTAIFKTINGRKLGKQVKSLNTKAIRFFHFFIHKRYHLEEQYSNAKLEEYHKDDIRCLTDLEIELGKNLKSRELIKNRAIYELKNEVESIILKINNI